jgi:hypothetical protein
MQDEIVQLSLEDIIMAKDRTSIVDHLKKDSPLLLECKKPQIMYIKHQNYGVRKLWRRLDNSK